MVNSPVHVRSIHTRSLTVAAPLLAQTGSVKCRRGAATVRERFSFYQKEPVKYRRFLDALPLLPERKPGTPITVANVSKLPSLTGSSFSRRRSAPSRTGNRRFRSSTAASS